MQNFTFTIDDLGFHGRDLSRPECVCCLESGVVVVSNGDGGVSRIDQDGTTRHITAPEGTHKPMTNGFAITQQGDFLLADLSSEGGVWKLRANGTCEPFITEVDGETLPSTNFVGVDAMNRVWATVSTRHSPRTLAYRKHIADGYIVLSDERGTRIVARKPSGSNRLSTVPPMPPITPCINRVPVPLLIASRPPSDRPMASPSRSIQ